MADVAIDERMAGATKALIVDTKLHAPALRREFVPRHELVALLTGGPPRKLVLLGAPAGWGKTTLLSEWRSAPDEERPFAWLSLDAHDSDPVRFWECLIAALGTVEPGLGAEAVPALRTPGASISETALPLLINELNRMQRSVILVLDDYHLVSDERVHESVAFLLDHLPETLRLAIATRSDPPFPVGRLRARGELTEIRAAQLRLTDEQATALLNGLLKLELDPADIRQLQNRTEGWAAGLQLAGLSLRGRDNPHEFISSFAGNDRQIVDYLVSDVLNGQPEDLRRFMLRTSILDRLSDRVCDAVTESSGSTFTLEKLERENLFLVELDSRREWYRYHHLFGELLRHELERTDPGLASDLHKRAAVWFRDEGLIPEAIHHAIAGGEIDDASDLISTHWPTFLQQGRQETVAAWLDALPEQAVRDDPRLALTRAWLSVNTGLLDELDRWIEAAESSAARDRDTSFEAAGAMLRCVHEYMDGNVGQSIEAARRALELEREETPPWRSVGCPVLGVSLFWRGDLADAERTLEEAVPRARRAGNNLAVIHATAALAAIHSEGGDLEEAGRLARTVSELGGSYDLDEHWATAMGHIAGGMLLEQSGQLAGADTEIARGVELARRGIARIEIAYGLLALARVRQKRGRTDDARALLEQARMEVGKCPDPGILAEMLGRTERRLNRGSNGQADGRSGRGDDLSERELAVLTLLPSPLSLREIGAELYVSLNTVKSHTRSIYRKLDAGTRDEAVDRARRLELL